LIVPDNPHALNTPKSNKFPTTICPNEKAQKDSTVKDSVEKLNDLNSLA